MRTIIKIGFVIALVCFAFYFGYGEGQSDAYNKMNDSEEIIDLWK